MTILKLELRQGRTNFLIWTAAIGALMAVCIALFPQMKQQAEDLAAGFASMGAFTAAFGMDRLNFGTLTGFYGVECGNILGLGGGLFAAMIGVNILSKEEQGHTAEFLLTHPIRRGRVLTEKLAAVLLQILIMNGLIYLLAIGSIMAIGEKIPWKELNLLHLAFFLMQVELACVCFGISAFLRRGGLGIGLGLAAIAYFLNILGNLSEDTKLLKWLTPFGYTEAADIMTACKLDTEMIALGMTIALLGIVAGYWKYTKKDIHA